MEKTLPNLVVFALGPFRSRMIIVEQTQGSDVGKLALASKGVYVLMVSSLPSFDVSRVATERQYTACRRIDTYCGLFWPGTPLFMVTFDFRLPLLIDWRPGGRRFKNHHPLAFARIMSSNCLELVLLSCLARRRSHLQTLRGGSSH